MATLPELDPWDLPAPPKARLPLPAPPIPREPPAIADLLLEGFTAAELSRLLALRAVYPYQEWIVERRSWHWLWFLRWQHRAGELDP